MAVGDLGVVDILVVGIIVASLVVWAGEEDGTKEDHPEEGEDGTRGDRLEEVGGMKEEVEAVDGTREDPQEAVDGMKGVEGDGKKEGMEVDGDQVVPGGMREAVEEVGTAVEGVGVEAVVGAMTGGMLQAGTMEAATEEEETGGGTRPQEAVEAGETEGKSSSAPPLHLKSTKYPVFERTSKIFRNITAYSEN